MIMNRRRLSGLLTGALVVGIVSGTLRPLPPAPEVGDREVAWTLPPVHDLQRHIAQDYAAVVSNMPWDTGGGDAGAAVVTATRWRLAGIITEKSPLILVMTPEQPDAIMRVHIGESLPDESVLDAVENDQALIRRGECITTWHLFHPQPIATSEACQATETPPQGTPP